MIREFSHVAFIGERKDRIFLSAIEVLFTLLSEVKTIG